MASEQPIRQEVSVDEQGLERTRDEADDQASLRPTVAQMTQAKADANSPDARPAGMTLEAEEQMRAREAEIARTRERAATDPDTTRERAARACSQARARQARREFAERRAAVDPWAAPDAPDPRATLDREELAAVHEQAARVVADVPRSAHRASVARRIARRVADGQDVLAASLAVKAAERAEPRRVVDIAAVGDVAGSAVTVEGEVATLFEASHPAIQDVGLIADDTGQTKFTIWTNSRVDTVREGERVRLVNVETSWHDRRVSVAVTGWSRVTKLDE